MPCGVPESTSQLTCSWKVEGAPETNWARPNDHDLSSILFQKPNPSLVLKYSLTIASLHTDSKEESFAQIYIMRHNYYQN